MGDAPTAPDLIARCMGMNVVSSPQDPTLHDCALKTLRPFAESDTGRSLVLPHHVEPRVASLLASAPEALPCLAGLVQHVQGVEAALSVPCVHALVNEAKGQDAERAGEAVGVLAALVQAPPALGQVCVASSLRPMHLCL
jgi:hypothetical protein